MMGSAPGTAPGGARFDPIAQLDRNPITKRARQHLPRVRDYKTRANRIERRSAIQALASEPERVTKEELL